MKQKQAAVNDGMIIRKLYRYSVVSIIISAVAAMFGILIDGVVIGKFLGTDSMAAYGLVSPLFSIMTAISGVLAAGSQVFCAKYLGSGKVDRARQVFSVCMIATGVISAVLIAALLILCDPLCVLLGAKGSSAALLPYAKAYLCGISPGLFPVILLFVFNSLMRLDGDPDRVVWAVIVMTAFDIAGDLLVALVFHAGMAGMGVSTAVSYYAGLIVLLMHFRKPDILFRFSWKDLRWKDLAGILRTGAPTAVGSSSTMVRNLILNRVLVSVAGNTAVAAFSVRNTLNNLFGSILLGVAMTTAMIAGMVYGEEDRTSEKHLMKVSLQYAVGIGLLMAVIVFAGAPFLVALFANGKADSVQMSAYAVRCMRIYAVGLPLYGVNQVFVSYLQGINRLKMANVVSALDNLIYVTAFALLLSPVWNVNAVWLAYPAGEALVILTVILAAAREKKQAVRGMEDLLFLPESFGAEPDRVYERSFGTVEEVLEASEELSGFMRERQATPKQCLLIPLCVEEMVKNVIEYGFTQDAKQHNVEIRVLEKDSDWIIRIRDNCRPFDPMEWIRIYHPEDPASNIGIRMVCGMAKSMEHVNAMQLNNLVIRV